MAPFSKEDKILIKSLYECKGYNALKPALFRATLQTTVQQTTGSFQSHPQFPEETCIIFGMHFG